MTNKEKKSKIADILMDFQEEYSNEVINRPMLASLYAGNILSFIDSLQEELVSEDFEKEIEKMWEQESKYRDTDYSIAELTKQDYEDCARHFANWQKEQDKQWLAEEHKHIFAKGRDSMKQQMMKDAVDAKITLLDGISYVSKDVLSQFKQGDKVKVIVIKED